MAVCGPRDLGLLGESTFAFWCVQAGLICNKSHVDKTGWDFYVEYPSHATGAANQLHGAAVDCKVQVKATDHRKRKIQVSLSNLRRLVTAQMPAFFVFLEFDCKDEAQSAFVVHVDDQLIAETLQRLHEKEEIYQRTDHHKYSMTVHYDDSHRLPILTGTELSKRILSYVPQGMADYVAKKQACLEKTGFENGFAQVTFKTDGEQNIKELVDVSIGARNSVAVKGLKGFQNRFGIKSRAPLFDSHEGRLEMPDLKPNAVGVIRFRQDRLSPSLAFECKLFISPFITAIPDRFAMIRIESDGFDLKMNISTGEIEYNFNADVDAKIPVQRLRDIIRLLQLISASGKKLLVAMNFENFPDLELEVDCRTESFELHNEIHALNCAVEILSDFGVSEPVRTTLQEISIYSAKISQFHSVIFAKRNLLRVEFSVEGEGFESGKRVVCISVVFVPVGECLLGAVLAISGSVVPIDGDRYELLATDAVVEHKLVSGSKGKIPREDLAVAVDAVALKYGDNHAVVNMVWRS